MAIIIFSVPKCGSQKVRNAPPSLKSHRGILETMETLGGGLFDPFYPWVSTQAKSSEGTDKTCS